MFNRNKSNAGIKLVIDAATAELLNHQADSEEYKKIVDQIERLNKIVASNSSEKVSANGVIAVLGNLLGIGMIIKHEQVAVITSKALGFVIKSRV
jgi:hypothetical protein